MAFDKKPSTWLGAGYALAANVAKFNTNSAGSNKLLTRIVDADADPTTGDIRKLFFALCDMMLNAWTTIAATPANLPGKMSVRVVNSTANAAGQITRQYIISFTSDATDIPVAAE